jgi:hypothetical protein
MHHDTLQAVGFLVAGALALVAMFLAFVIVRFVLRFTTDAVGQVIRAMSRLVFTTVSDLRFACMLSVVFCLVAERHMHGHTPKIALTVSASAFVLTVGYIAWFLLQSVFLRRVQTASEGVADLRLRKALNDWALQVQLNVGFLGLIYLCIAFSSLCYSYYMACEQIEMPEYQWVVDHDKIEALALDDDGEEQIVVRAAFENKVNRAIADTGDLSETPRVDYEICFRHTWQMIQKCFPVFVQRQLDIGPPLLSIPEKAIGLEIVTWVFRKAFWGAFFALVWAIAQPGRIFRAL